MHCKNTSRVFVLLVLIFFIFGVLSAFLVASTPAGNSVSHSKVLKENLNAGIIEKGSVKRINNIAIDIKDYEPSESKVSAAKSTDKIKGASEDKSKIDSALRNFIDSNSDALEISSQNLASDKVFYDKPSKDSEAEGTWYVSYKQTYSNIPVENTLVSVLVIDGKIVQLKSETYGGIQLSAIPDIEKSDAVDSAKQMLGIPDSIVPHSVSLAILPDKSKKPVEYSLAWKIEFPLIEGENSEPFAWIAFVDAHTGVLIHKYNRVVFGEVTGQVTGMVRLANSSSAATLVNFSNNNVSAYQNNVFVASNVTNSSGGYNISGISGVVTIKSNLSGPYVKVSNADQASTNHIVNVSVSGTANWNWSEIDNSSNDEESTMFYHVNKIHDFFTSGDPFNITDMNYQIPATVEYGTNYCNAFYSSPTAGIFFGNSASCGNLALSSDIIYHEYTHAVSDQIYVSLPYSDMTGAIDEALADYFAATINNDPRCAEANWNPYLRTLDNSDVYPADWAGEVHADSTMLSGAFWDMRESLGSNVTDEYIIKSIKAQASSFSEFLDDFLIFNDNNTNLSDGAPNSTQICAAFTNNHGIQSQYCNSSILGFSITEGASYSWVNAVGLGTKVNASVSTAGLAGMEDDDVTSAVNLGFSFPFYHHNYTSVRIGSNGLLTFSSFTPSLFEFCSLPATVAPNNMISVFCADFDPSASGDVYYWNDNANNVFVAEWFKVPLYGTNNFSTVEAVLYDDGKIKLQYVNITNNTFGYAAIGTENIAGTAATVYYNHSYVDRLDSFALLFVPANTAPNITSFQPAAGNVTINENSSLQLNISVNDPDFDNMTFEWYLNGTLKNTTQNITLSFNTTSSGNYLVRFVAADIYKSNGSQEWNLTVNDISSPPSASNVAITPSAAYINSTLNCTYTYSGGNSESGTIITWFTNSNFNSSFENSTSINSSFLTRYANWTCQAVPRDGITSGTAVNSSQVTVQNAAPITTAPSLNVSSANKTTDIINCRNSTFTDLENDSAQWHYNWFINTTLTNITSNNITNSSFNHFDNITCQVTPFDGASNGTAINSSVLAVQNIAPSAPTNITPVFGVYGPKNQLVNISCSNSSDLDGDTISYNLQAYYSSSWNSLALLDSDGNYSWNISSLTTQSNILLRCNASDSFSTSVFMNQSSNITVDNTAPSLTLSAPTNNSFYNTSNVSVRFAAFDAVYSTLQGCWLVNSTGSLFGLANCANLTYLEASDGLKNITVYVNDSVNNVNSSSIFFTIDTVFPSLAVSLPVNVSFYNSTNVSLMFSVNDTNLASCWFTNTTGADLALAVCANITFKDTVNGLRNITVFVNDSAGNVNSSNIFFTVDSVFPALIAASPANNSYLNSTNVSLMYSAVDSNLNSCWFVNTTGHRINLTGCINATLLESNGNKNITLYVNDTAGNLNVSQLFFTVDTVFPSLVVSLPVNVSFYNSTNVSLMFSVNDTNLDKCLFTNVTGSNVSLPDCLNATLRISDGFRNITLFVNDSANNVNSSVVFFTVDSVFPSLSVVSPVNGSFYNSSNVSLMFSVSDTNLNACWLINTSGARINLSGCANLTVLDSNAFKNITLYVNDSAGNLNSTDIYFTIDTIHPTEPVLQGQTPANNSFVNTSYYVVNVSFFEVNPSFCWLFNTTAARLNLTLTAINTTAAYCNATVQAGEGLHNYSVYVNDSAGNLNQSSAYFVTTDTIVPSINISSLSNNSYHNRTVIDVNFSGLDQNIDKCWMTNITGANQSFNNCTNISVTFAALAAGAYNFTIYANDSAHNINSSQIFFTIQLSPPTISNVTSSSVTSSGAIVAVTTSVLANATVSYGTTVAFGSTALSSAFAASSSITLSSLSASTLYYYNITSCNNAGFCNTSGIYNFTTSAAPSNSPGGGGGGGGGGSSASASSTSTLNYIWPALSSGVSKVSVSQPEIAFSSVSLDVSAPTAIKNAALEIRGSVPASEISEKAEPLEKEVYQYLSVTPSVVTNDFIESVNIVFKVNKSWLSSKELDQNSIYLYHYISAEKNWVELPTDLLDESQINASGADKQIFAYYSAASPGFSYFAIAPKTKASVSKNIVEQNAALTSAAAEENITTSPVSEPALSQNNLSEITDKTGGKETSKQSFTQFVSLNKKTILFVSALFIVVLFIVLLKKFMNFKKSHELRKAETSIKKFIDEHETKKLQELKQELEKEKLPSLTKADKTDKKRRRK